MKKKQFVFMSLTLVGRTIGLLREMVLSYYYGASAMSDAYTVATTFSSVIFAGVAATILNGIIPDTVESKREGNASGYINSIFRQTVIFSFVLSLVLFLLLKVLLKFMANGFSEQAFGWAYELSLYVLIFAPFLCFINVLVGYLQVEGHFNSLPVQSLVTNTVMIAVFWLSSGNIKILGLGYGASVIMPFAVIFIYSLKNGFAFDFWDRSEKPKALRTWLLIIPTFGVQIAAQLNSIVDRSFASSLGEGVVSMMKYAFLLCTMVVSVVAIPIGMMRYPVITESVSSGNLSEANRVLIKTLKEIIVLTLPIVVIIMFFSKLIVSLLFGRGAFDSEDVMMTAEILSVYAISIIGNSMMEILSRVMLSVKKTSKLFIFYCIYVAFNVFLNFNLIKVWGANGLALGTTISAMVMAGILYLYVKYAVFAKNLKQGEV